MNDCNSGAEGTYSLVTVIYWLTCVVHLNGFYTDVLHTKYLCLLQWFVENKLDFPMELLSFNISPMLAMRIQICVNLRWVTKHSALAGWTWKHFFTCVLVFVKAIWSLETICHIPVVCGLRGCHVTICPHYPMLVKSLFVCLTLHSTIFELYDCK